MDDETEEQQVLEDTEETESPELENAASEAIEEAKKSKKQVKRKFTEQEIEKILHASDMMVETKAIKGVLDEIQKSIVVVNHSVDVLESKVANLEGATISIINELGHIKQPRSDTQATPATARSVDADDVLRGLSPDITKQLDVYEKEGEIRVKPKGYLGKNTWITVNKTLKQDGFQWHSEAKNSYWHK